MELKRHHLGLIIPEGDLGLKVGSDNFIWKKGELISFIDGVEHSAWNNSSDLRVVLIIDTTSDSCSFTNQEFIEFKLKNITDKHLLSIGSQENWDLWRKQGQLS